MLTCPFHCKVCVSHVYICLSCVGNNGPVLLECIVVPVLTIHCVVVPVLTIHCIVVPVLTRPSGVAAITGALLEAGGTH